MTEEKYAIVTKIGDVYKIKIPKTPTGFTYDIEEIYKQIEHLKGLGFVIIEDRKHPLHLDDIIN